MKIVFLGSPQIARICLEKILKAGHKVLAVITKLDKPAGRGKKIVFSPVKECALKNGLPVYQFKNVSKDGVKIIKDLKPDVLVLVAFGQILSQEILDIALPINLHGSYLPKLRGPSPIQTAILNGEVETGATVMKMADGIDNGDILLQEKIKIAPMDTSQELFEKMAEIGGNLLIKALYLIENNKAKFAKQNNAEATFCTYLTKDNAKIDFSTTAKQVVNKIRAYNPNPIAYMVLNNVRYKVFSANVYEKDFNKKARASEIIFADKKKGLVIMAKDKPVEIQVFQAPNGKKLSPKDFFNGNKIL